MARTKRSSSLASHLPLAALLKDTQLERVGDLDPLSIHGFKRIRFLRPVLDLERSHAGDDHQSGFGMLRIWLIAGDVLGPGACRCGPVSGIGNFRLQLGLGQVADRLGQRQPAVAADLPSLRDQLIQLGLVIVRQAGVAIQPVGRLQLVEAVAGVVTISGSTA